MGHIELTGLIGWDFVNHSVDNWIRTLDMLLPLFIFFLAVAFIVLLTHAWSLNPHPTGKGIGPPLAFRCIKSNGGLVPQTLVRVVRIYPILYKER